MQCNMLGPALELSAARLLQFLATDDTIEYFPLAEKVHVPDAPLIVIFYEVDRTMHGVHEGEAVST